MTSKGKFLVVEGLDGAGSTTQVMSIRNELRSRKVSCEVTKEPSNGPFGAVIRSALDKRVPISPRALALAFAADRADHLDHLIIEHASGFSGSANSSTGEWISTNKGVKALLERG